MGDSVTSLVGSIIEKGISENKPPNKPLPPRPTLLSFPVARHRSHGPHWSPVGSRAQPKDYDVDEEEEEERFMNADSIAAFAQPLQRKEKKDMELSRWKDMVSGDDPASTYDPQKSRKLKIIDTRPLSVPSPHVTTTSVNTLLAKKSQSLAGFDMASDQREIFF